MVRASMEPTSRRSQPALGCFQGSSYAYTPAPDLPMIPPRSPSDWLADLVVLEGVTLADHLDDCPSCTKPRHRCRVGAHLLQCTPASKAWRLPEHRHVLDAHELGFLQNARRRAAYRLGSGQLIPPPAVDRELLEDVPLVASSQGSWVRTADRRFARWTRFAGPQMVQVPMDRVELNLEVKTIRARATARGSGVTWESPEVPAAIGDVIRLRVEVERWVEATP